MESKLFVTGVKIFLKNGSNPISDILIRLGKKDEVEALLKEYEEKKHKGPFGLEQMAKFYGEFSESEVKEEAEKYVSENLKEGTKELVKNIKQKGYIIGVISANPQLVLDILKKEFSLDFAVGTEFDFEKGELKSKVDRFKKAEILNQKAKELGIDKENIVVLGSSVSDLPMAENAGKFIVAGAKDEAVRQQADVLMESWEEELFLKEL